MNRIQIKQQSRVFRALSNADLILVQPGFRFKKPAILGLHGDHSDLAISLKRHDAAGCKWEADFTKKSLINTSVRPNRMKLTDSVGEEVFVDLYKLTPHKFAG